MLKQFIAAHTHTSEQYETFTFTLDMNDTVQVGRKQVCITRVSFSAQGFGVGGSNSWVYVKHDECGRIDRHKLIAGVCDMLAGLCDDDAWRSAAQTLKLAEGVKQNDGALICNGFALCKLVTKAMQG